MQDYSEEWKETLDDLCAAEALIGVDLETRRLD
jgi:hypothetical protein